MNNFESINQTENKEAPKIVIKRSTEAPEKAKQNPFYDEEFWGRALSPDDIYLPDSDMAISFAIAAHEIGHLSGEGAEEEKNITQANFEATAKEEQRAWTVGKRYLQDCIDEYFADDAESKQAVAEAIDKIEEGMMGIVEWSRPLYLDKGALDGMDDEEREKKLKESREMLAAEKIGEFKSLVESGIKAHKLGRRVDWERFTALVKKSVERIVDDDSK
jgi:hypothetical protein